MIVEWVAVNTHKQTPAVISNRDVMMKVQGRMYRLAVERWLVSTKGWSIFHCYTYPTSQASVDGLGLGFLVVPSKLIDEHFLWLPRAPRFRRIIGRIERSWNSLAEEKKSRGMLSFFDEEVKEWEYARRPAMFTAELSCMQTVEEESEFALDK